MQQDAEVAFARTEEVIDSDAVGFGWILDGAVGDDGLVAQRDVYDFLTGCGRGAPFEVKTVGHFELAVLRLSVAAIELLFEKIFQVLSRERDSHQHVAERAHGKGFAIGDVMRVCDAGRAEIGTHAAGVAERSDSAAGRGRRGYGELRIFGEIAGELLAARQ